MQEGFEFGFYNSKSDSVREYDAKQFGRMFDGVITDGVFSSIGNNFLVTSNGSLKIKVGTGRAWLNHTWNEVTQDMEFKCENSDPTNPRMDTVVLQVNGNELVRENKIYIKKGTVASAPLPPDLEFDNDIQLWEYPIAVITIPANIQTITNSNITNLIGLDNAPANMSKYTHLLSYAYVISNNSMGSATLIVHTGESANETAWTSFNGMYKKVFSNMNNIQNTISISKNSMFNTDLLIRREFQSNYRQGVSYIKKVQDAEESFSYIYKYEINDNANQLILYSYYQTKVEVEVRFMGKGINKLS